MASYFLVRRKQGTLCDCPGNSATVSEGVPGVKGSARFAGSRTNGMRFVEFVEIDYVDRIWATPCERSTLWLFVSIMKFRIAEIGQIERHAPSAAPFHVRR